MIRCCVALLLVLSRPALADVEVRFVEGAPTDRFVITNTGACALGTAKITIDLGGSAAGLIFDTTGAGAGVQVFQPFQLVQGADLVQDRSDVRDGDQIVTLTLGELPPGQSVAFTIDVDDTIGQREITVSGSEIAGAAVTVANQTAQARGRFSASALAVIPRASCGS